MKKIYFDYAATTPLDRRVLKEMLPFFDKKYANTMSFHSMGTFAAESVEKSREIIAKSINANIDEIIFTGSATESNNMVLKGLIDKNHNKNKIIVSCIEHDCIHEAAQYLKTKGFNVVFLKVDKYGFIDVDELQKEIDEKTLVVSVIHGNNEMGTVQDVEKIGKICSDKKVIFHSDMSQSYTKEIIDVKKMNIDMCTLSSHKIYGPKGAAVLYIKKGIRITPLFHGGGHENNLRSSTLNVPAIIGFAKAAEIAMKDFEKENKRLVKMRDYIISTIQKNISSAKLNGHPTKRLSNNINFSFPFAEGEALLVALDMAGIECSTGSACSSATLEPSRVIMNLGATPVQAHGSLRISLGRFTTDHEVKYFLEILPKVLDKVKNISPFSK